MVFGHQDQGSEATVLCVDISADELPASIQDLVHDHPFKLIHCDTVYAAMAKIRSVEPTFVVVRVDWLTGDEFEFFSICRRSYPEVCVFATGHPRSASKVQQAIDSGATAKLSPLAIADWMGGKNNSETFAFADNEFDAESEASTFGGVPIPPGESDPADLRGIALDDVVDPGDAGGIKHSGEPPAAPSVEEPDSIDEPDSVEEPDRAEDSKLAEGELPAPDLIDTSLIDNDSSDTDSADIGEVSDDFDDCEGERENSVRACVPWSNVARGPVRTPPTRSKPIAPESLAPEVPLPEVLVNDPPLLSPEEMSLLLGEA
ncbi:MAG: hypothetical protein GXP29_11670 [Planctomycetes bacterium]|nr:hypothetical protein [Planctomycetota bacterium]